MKVGRRGSSLIFLGLLDVTVAWSLVDPPAETLANIAYQFIAVVAPLPWWALVWAIVGVVCLVQAFMRSDRIAFAMAAGLKMAWASMFALAWILQDAPRGWLAAAIWMAFGIWVLIISAWPEADAPREVQE